MKVLAWPAFDYEPFNPYNWLLNKNLEKHQIKIIPYSHKRVLTEGYDIWHMHWPAENVIRKSLVQSCFRFIGFFLLLILAKFKKAKIVWTAHNFELHDGLHPLIENLFWKLFPSLVDGYIIHSNYANKLLLKRHPVLKSKKHTVIYHGHYKEWYPNNIGKSEARKYIGVEKNCFVFLFLGSIRPYKNLPILLEAFTGLTDGGQKLVIAGKSNSEKLDKHILEYSETYANISYDRKWVEDEEFQYYFNASDIAVLPYNIPSSGMALLSLSFNCPVLMPSNPMLEEYKNIIKGDLFFLYENGLSSSVLDDVQNKLQKKQKSENDLLSSLNWYELAFQTKQFYSEVLNENTLR